MKMPQQYQQSAQFNQEMVIFSMGLGMLFLIAILFTLHYYRGKFRASEEPPQSATPALP
jgi:flagellar biogenesis protein FliO